MYQSENWVKYDLLRGLAAVAVLFSHAVATYLQRLLGREHALIQVSVTLARHAVLLFFLLSGYLITRSIMANIRRHGCFDAREYLVARLTRIYPPFLGSILIVIVAWGVIHGLDLPGAVHYGMEGDLFAVRPSFALRPRDLALALSMQEGMLLANGPLWSLYIEFHLYLVAMCLACAMYAEGWGRGRWFALAFAICLLKVYRAPQTLLFGSVWFLGAAAALWGRPLTSAKGVAAASRVAGLLAATLALMLVIRPSWLMPDQLAPVLSGAIQFGACVVYAHVLFMAPDLRFSIPSWLRQSADYSYSLYVIHFPLLLLVLSVSQGWMGHSLARSIVALVGAMCFCIAVAFWFARFFENQGFFRPWIDAALGRALSQARRFTAAS